MAGFSYSWVGAVGALGATRAWILRGWLFRRVWGPRGSFRLKHLP